MSRAKNKVCVYYMKGSARVLCAVIKRSYTTATDVEEGSVLKPVPNAYSSASSHAQRLQQKNLDSRKMYGVPLTRERFL